MQADSSANGDKAPAAGPERFLAALRAAADRVEVEAGQPVTRQDEERRELYLVESGAVDVVVLTAEGVPLPIARLGPGDHFGEMSLLTGAPVSADVIACEPSVLYRVTATEFDEIVRRDRRFMEHLARELAARLQATNEQLAALQERQAALGRLIAARPANPFQSDLPSLERLAPEVDQAAASDRPLLIIGEEGVGRRSLAHHIHSRSARRHRGVLVVYCGDLAEETARQELFGDAQPEAVGRFADRLGYVQAADGGTLILAEVDRLPTDAQEALATFLSARHGTNTGRYVNVRLIATSALPREELEQGDALCGPLREALTEEAIEVRPLRRRRRDIVALAEHFLSWGAQQSEQEQQWLTDGARRELLAYDFRFGNVRELRQVVLLAAQLAEGQKIGPEHLFFGPAEDEGPIQVDLLRWPWLKQALLGGRLLVALKVVTGLAFAAIIAACLLTPESWIGRGANTAVWALWWPALIVSLLILGRAWCAVCPLSGSAELLQQVAGRGRAPGDWLKHAGPPLALIGFVGIIWVEQIASMAERPRNTAVLLLVLAGAAALMGWIFQRHAWCRYLCPLGAMGAVMSVASSLRVRARREVCGASCVGQECYKGSADVPGCPMSTHVLLLSTGQHCKLCMACLRSCPSGSPRLLLQAPLRDIWGSDPLAADLAPLALVVGLVAWVLTAAPRGDPSTGARAAWFTMSCVGVIAVGLMLTHRFRSLRQAKGSRGLAWWARLFSACAPAAAALLFAFHLISVPWIADTDVRLVPPGQAGVGLSLLQLAQGAAILIGGCMTLWTLWRVCRARYAPPGRLSAALGAWALPAFLVVAGLLSGLAMLS